MAQHFVIIEGNNGEAIQFPLKLWVRQNLALLPQGFNPVGTSHQLRGRLAQIGWTINITENAIYVIQPDNNGQFQYAEEFLNDLVENDNNEIIENEDIYEVTFSLERDLQAALRQNITTLENGLQIIDNGRERKTVAGRIDITAIDNEGKTVVIELKAVEAKPDVLAQVLAYMEAVQQEDNAQVRGIIVARGFSERVRLAARQIPHVKLLTYSFQFNFNVID